MWFYCNKTTVKSDGSSPLSSPTIASRFTTKMKHNLYNSNELLNPQLNNKVTKEILLHGSDTASSSASSTLNTRKLKDNKDNALFHEKSFKTIEKCYYFKFYFKGKNFENTNPIAIFGYDSKLELYSIECLIRIFNKVFDWGLVKPLLRSLPSPIPFGRSLNFKC